MKSTALGIVEKLQKAGFETYWAGGCVRDMLMKKEPNDFDIVTSAKPEEVQKILPKTFGVGKQFGVIIAHVGIFHFEIATFRSEAEYKDSRRPSKVFYTNAQNDAKRRDFTINGMFFDPIKNKVIDYVDGQKDISAKIIRFIGNPDERIKEDHLRLLRAVRFKNILGFNYEKRTWEAVKNNSYRISSVSAERIADELNKMFIDKNRANTLIDLDKSGLLEHVLPEITKLKKLPQPKQFHKEGDVFDHTVMTLEALKPESPITLVWAALLHDVGKADTISFPKNKHERIRYNKHVKFSAGIASRIARRLKFPNTERELIVWLVKNHMIIGDIPKMKLSRQRRFLMDSKFPWLLELARVDAQGMIPKNTHLYKKNLDLYNKAQELHKEEAKKPKYKPLITGKDLIYHFKLSQGPEIGRLLKIAEDAQLEGKIKTKKEALEYIEKEANSFELTSSKI